jgi:hypothetical protein
MGVPRIVLECGPLKAPTLTTIDQIARLQLEAQRCGCRLELKDAGPELAALIGFCGLSDLLRVEVERQSEERKDLRGVEEKSELQDPSARELEDL